MPGRAEHVEGVVTEEQRVYSIDTGRIYTRREVDGLQKLLAKFDGKKVSIIIEELDEDE